MLKGVIYVRVSTEEQAKEGQSIESQLRICQQYANENDITIAEKFVDEGKSATNMNRPALQDMLALVQGGGIDIVLVQDTDRLARNTLDHLKIKAILKKADTKLVSVSQPIIDDSPEGHLIDTMLAATNTFQSQITGRKTSKVMEQKAMQSWFPGGTPPLGYRNADNPSSTSSLDRRIIVVDHDVAPVIRELFELYATGKYNTEELRQFLLDKAIKPPYGRTIHQSLVANTLGNRFYIGTFTWKKKEYSGKHETFISPELFEKVQQVLSEHNQGASRKRKHNFLLRGFLYCDVCGARYWSEKHNKNGKEYRFYFCKSCVKGTYVDMDSMEEQVAAKFKEIEITPEYKEEVMQVAEKIVAESRENRDSEKRRLEKTQASYYKALREAEDDRYIHHTITSEDFNRISDRFRGLLENIQRELAGLDVDHAERLRSLEMLLSLTENIGETYRIADDSFKREYLATFFKKFYIKEGKIVQYDLSPDIKEMVEEGSVRVRTKGLPVHELIRNLHQFIASPDVIGAKSAHFSTL